jgi:hypothetical protein
MKSATEFPYAAAVQTADQLVVAYTFDIPGQRPLRKLERGWKDITKMDT